VRCLTLAVAVPVVVDDGRVFSAGGNTHGQLGLGDTEDRAIFTHVAALAGQEIRRVACGAAHAAAVSGTALSLSLSLSRLPYPLQRRPDQMSLSV
jgi:alpha-tubulin suppressor-like RCC1 family protein